MSVCPSVCLKLKIPSEKHNIVGLAVTETGTEGQKDNVLLCISEFQSFYLMILIGPKLNIELLLINSVNNFINLLVL